MFTPSATVHRSAKLQLGSRSPGTASPPSPPRVARPDPGRPLGWGNCTMNSVLIIYVKCTPCTMGHNVEIHGPAVAIYP